MNLILLLLLLCAMTSAHIEQQTFKEFFYNTYDLDRDDKFTFENWLAYYLFLEPEMEPDSPILRETFDHYDLDNDRTVTIDQMLNRTIHITWSPGPKQLHIGFTGKDGQMQVMWVTQPDRYPKPIVKYGEIQHKLNKTANATWTSYNKGKIGFYGRIYRAVMTGLDPLKKYYYKVGDHLIGVFSGTHSFIAPPNKGTHLDRIHFVAVGDMGTYVPMGHYVSEAIYIHGVKDPFDFVFLNGDIAYAGVSSDKVGELEPIWDLFGQQIEKYAAKTPFMPGVGNHEHYYNYTSYTNRYYLPRSEGSNQNYWFAFDYGQLHMIHLSSEHSFKPGSDQYKFLQNDLQKARSNGYTQWIVVAAHRPFYSSDKNSYSDSRPLIKQLQELLNKYEVDLVQAGHEHSYERMWPVYKGKAIFEGSNTTHYVKPQTPIYIVQGTGGAMIRYSFVKPSPQWSMRTENKWGFGRIQIKGKVLKYQFIGVDGGVIDEWRIVK